MIGVPVYHKIKALREGHSIRDCARRLDISPATVSKYAQLSLEEACSSVGCHQRSSQFDPARDYILKQLSLFPRISAVKLLRKVKERYPEICAKERAFRNYIAPLRKAAAPENIRYYEPVLDMEPGRQVQVDIGEEWVERDSSGSRFKVYFVSFVFSYSRKQYVYFQGGPYNTESFIKAHIEAFRYFGGIAKEYVYDQTKFVVITEKYREVFFNERFHQFALKYELSPRVCEGYDPESKGKVERSIGYVKADFLYGDYFIDVPDVRKGSLHWLNEVANCRLHATTKRRPVDMFEEERSHLNQRVDLLDGRPTRWADKTGLISFEGNKFSVPYQYQRKEVWVLKVENILIIKDKNSGEQIATHEIPPGRGHIIKNNNHYRDYRKSVETLTYEALTLFEELPGGSELVERIKADNPKIMRDQLRALAHLRRKYSLELWQAAMPTLRNLPHLRATLIESILDSYQQRQCISQIESDSPLSAIDHHKTSSLERSLDCYMEVIANDEIR